MARVQAIPLCKYAVGSRSSQDETIWSIGADCGHQVGVASRSKKGIEADEEREPGQTPYAFHVAVLCAPAKPPSLFLLQEYRLGS